VEWQGFHLRFQHDCNWFSHAGKTFGAELVYRKNFALGAKPGGQNDPHSGSICLAPDC